MQAHSSVGPASKKKNLKKYFGNNGIQNFKDTSKLSVVLTETEKNQCKRCE